MNLSAFGVENICHQKTQVLLLFSLLLLFTSFQKDFIVNSRERKIKREKRESFDLGFMFGFRKGKKEKDARDDDDAPQQPKELLQPPSFLYLYGRKGIWLRQRR